MFSWLKKEAIKVNRTNKGSHGDHWYGLFNEEIEKSVMNHLKNTFENGTQLIVDKKTTVVTDNLIRAIVHKGNTISAFPYRKGLRYEGFETNSITEWTHSNNLEAVIKVTYPGGCGIGFFATDYSFNKDLYRKQKKLSVNIIGLVYMLEDFNVEEFNKGDEPKFSHDFCGYMPKDTVDEIEFIGHIQNIKEHDLGNIPGFIITLKITPHYNLDLFMSKTKLQITLELNKHVGGQAWIQGTLEK